MVMIRRWRTAAILDSWIPQVKGRGRIIQLVQGRRTPKKLNSVCTIQWGLNLRFTCTPSTDGSLMGLVWNQWRRPVLSPILETFLSPGDVFIDVGANVGLYSTWASRIVGASGRVIALEPNAATAEILHAVITENSIDNIEIHRVAASSLSGGLLNFGSVKNASGLTHVLLPGEKGDFDAPTVRLDDIVSDLQVALVKIDVEGHEIEVLRGFLRTLSSTAPPPIVFEAQLDSSDATRECVELLEENGYEVFSLTPRGCVPFDARNFSSNLLAVPTSRSQQMGNLVSTKFPVVQNL